MVTQLLPICSRNWQKSPSIRRNKAMRSFHPRWRRPRFGFLCQEKEKTAAKVGIESRLLVFPESLSEKELLGKISELNEDHSVHGILVQAPLPSHMDDRKVFNHVAPHKDVDGFNATNLGLLCQENEDAFASCTPAGILELLKRTKVDTTGKHVVVLGKPDCR